MNTPPSRATRRQLKDIFGEKEIMREIQGHSPLSSLVEVSPR
jgi:hypothetical protein